MQRSRKDEVENRYPLPWRTTREGYIYDRLEGYVAHLPSGLANYITDICNAAWMQERYERQQREKSS